MNIRDAQAVEKVIEDLVLKYGKLTHLVVCELECTIYSRFRIMQVDSSLRWLKVRRSCYNVQIPFFFLFSLLYSIAVFIVSTCVPCSFSVDISIKGWQAVIDANLNGTWNVTRAVFHHTMRENGGTIVTITVANQNGFPTMAHSGAARAGIENMMKTLAAEWGPFGLRLNCVSAGSVIGSGLTSYPAPIRSLLVEKLHSKVHTTDVF